MPKDVKLLINSVLGSTKLSIIYVVLNKLLN